MIKSESYIYGDLAAGRVGLKRFRFSYGNYTGGEE